MTAAVSSPEALAQEWRRRVAMVLRHPVGGWDQGAAEGVVETAAGRRNPGPLLQRWTVGRREIGISYEECVSELLALMDLVGRTSRQRLDRLAVGIAVGSVYAEERMDALSFDDVPPGMVSRRFLVDELRHLYRGGQVRGTGSAAELVILFLETASSADPLELLIRPVLVGVSVETVARDAPLVYLSDTRYALLISRASEVLAGVERIRSDLARSGIAVRISCEALPPHLEDALMLVNLATS
jgi:hypothetical protein